MPVRTTDTPESIAPPIPWRDFLDRFQWRQGEHVTIVGPTGVGKTHLILSILERRTYVVFFAAKPHDPLIDALERDGYHLTKELPFPPPQLEPRIIYWPRIRSVDDIKSQRAKFAEAFKLIYTLGGSGGNYCVVLDETNYFTQYLRLSPLVELFWRQGRSLGASLVAATQRPFHIPLLAYDQATHVFFFRENDEANLRRIGSMGVVSSRELIQAVSGLRACALGEGEHSEDCSPNHQLLYLNTRDGRMMVTEAPARS